MKDFIKINSIAIVTKLLGAIFSLLSISFLTRILTNVEYGKYVLLSSTVNIFAVIFFQWIAVVASRYLTMNPKYILFYIKNNLVLISAVLFGIALVLTFLLKDIRICIVALTGISFGIYNVNLQIENSLERWRSYNYLLLSKYFITFVFLVICLYFFKSSNFAILALFIGTFLSILSNKKINHEFDFSDKIETKLFQFGVVYTLIIILNSIIDFADRYLIEYYKGYSSVGMYSANYDLIQQTVGGFLGVFAIYFTPKILKSKNQRNKLMFKKLNDRYLKFTLLCGSFLFFNFFIAYPIISIVISEKYRYTSFFEIIFILLGIIFSIIKGAIFDLNLQIEGKYNILIYNMLIIGCFNVFLNIILIPKYGQLGAAFSTFMAFFVGLINSAYFSRKYLKRPNVFYKSLSELIILIALILCVNIFFYSDTYVLIILKNIIFTFLFSASIIISNIFGIKSYIRLMKINLRKF